MPKDNRIDALLHAISSEYSVRQNEIAEPFSTVYIGGGTPSIVEPEKLARLLDTFPLDSVEEFTIEANPEDISPDLIKAWRDLGINRVSMGIQSFDDNELTAIRRRHSSTDAIRAVECLLKEGIDNISCDLIYGLPGQSVKSWKQSLNRLLEFRLPHFSAYCLSYEPGTALYARMTSGKITPTDDDTLFDMYAHLCDAAQRAGYEHYEISNFAKPGLRSRHNSSYWTGTPYLGLGPGAHSFDGETRRYNPGDLSKYISTSANTLVDEETPDQRFNDMLITALRTSDGIDIMRLPSKHAKYIASASAPFLSDGQMIVTESGRLRISEEAWFKSDAILRELIV